jgi:hypothetical protein
MTGDGHTLRWLPSWRLAEACTAHFYVNVNPVSIISVWRVNRDICEPMTYAVVLAILLLVRIGSHLLLPAPSSLSKLSRQ